MYFHFNRIDSERNQRFQGIQASQTVNMKQEDITLDDVWGEREMNNELSKLFSLI